MKSSDLHKSLSESLDDGTYHEVKYRWVVFGVYVIGALVNSLPAQAFSSINSLVETRFHYSPTIVTLNTLIFPISHPILAFPANWMLDKYGMAIGCFFGGLILIAGVWLRTFIQVDEPAVCLIGSLLAAFGNLFIYNSPTILATNWFKPKSVPGIISICVTANLISVGLGASLPGLILDKQSTAEQIRSFLRVEALVISIPILLMLVLLRNKPKISPSKAAGTQGKLKQKYVSVLKKLFTNKEYLKIMVAMIFSNGTLTSYLAILDQCIASMNKNADSGQIAAEIFISAVFTGILATPFFVNRIKATFQYRILCMFTLGFTFANFSLTQLALAFEYTQPIAVIILGVCTGFFLVPITALLVAYGSECAFPLGQGSAAGYLFAGCQTFGFLLGLSCVSIVDKQNPWKTYIILAMHSIFFLFAFIAVFFTKETLNRTKFQIQQQHLFPSQQQKLIVSSKT